MSVNLYQVSGSDYKYGCFVFATSRNKAKQRLVGFFDDTPYIDFRCKTLKRGLADELDGAVVDDDKHHLYPLVEKLGFRYAKEDEE